MAIKFLSGLNLSNVTAGSILKLDSNGNIVAAVDGTDYNTSSADSWSDVSSDIYRNSDVRIGTYQSGVAPAARLHVFDYQTTDPKLLIEDGNTGDASMEFKISTQSYTMGIDNSDSDKFILAASTALGTTNVLEVSTTGTAAFQKQVLFNETINLPGDGTSSREILINAHGTRGKLMKEGNATYWQVAQGGNQFEITDAANGNDTKGNVMLRVHGNDANDNEIYLAVNGGNVGIGTTSPGASLHVASTTNDFVAKFSHSTATGYAPGSILLEASQATSRGQGIYHYNTNADESWFTGVPYNVSSNKWIVANKPDTTFNPDVAQLSHALLTIEDNGRVGIGTTSPEEKLHVIGNIKQNDFIIGRGAQHIAASMPDYYKIAQVTIDATYGTSHRIEGTVSYGGDNEKSTKIDFWVSFRSGGNLNVGTPLVRYGYRVENLNVASSNGFESGSVDTAFRVSKTSDTSGGNKVYEIQFSPNDANYINAHWEVKYSDYGNQGSYPTTVYSTLQSYGTDIADSNILKSQDSTRVDNNTWITQLGVGSSNNTSYSFYNNNTSYFNGSVTVDANLSMTGGGYITTDSSNALTLRSDVQHGQGDEDAVISFKQSTTELGKFDQDGYLYAAGFKKSGTTGFLKSDGTVDTTTLGTMASAATSDYKTSDATETYVATELASYTLTSALGTNAFTSYTDHSTQGYLTSYTEADTLDSVTGRGATTTNNISVGNLSAVGGTFTDPVTIYDTTINENPRLSVGRSSGESIQFDVVDTVNTIRAKQDSDSDGDHTFVIDRVFAGSGDSIFRIENDSTPDLTIDGNGVVTLNQYGTAGILQINTSGTISVDTNTYSTATGVEDNADVTDATNVAAAGALMTAGGTMTGELKLDSNFKWATANASSYTYSNADSGGLYIETVGSTDALSDMRFQARASGAGNYSSIAIKPSNQSIVLRTNGTNALVLDTSQNATLAGKLYIGSVAATTTATTALLLGAAGEVKKRSLGSNAFSSTSFLPLAGGTVTGQVIFPSASTTKPVLPNGYIARNDSADTDGTHDIWGISERYYPSNSTDADAWGIQWSGTPNEINFIGAGQKKLSIDLDTDGAVKIDGNAIATESYVGTAISNLVDSSPAALDTLNELAAALGDDASFSTTMSTALGNRLRIDVNNQSLSSTELANARTNLGLGTAATAASTAFVAVSGDTMTGDLTVEGSLTVGKDATTPQVKLIYDDNHTNGDRWDTIIDIGRTQDRHSGDNEYPTYVTADGYSISFQSASDGVLFGMEAYNASNHRPVIAWGDDNSDTPFNFRFNNGVVLSLGYNGVLTSTGNMVAGGNFKTTGNLDMREQNQENSTNVIYFNANNGNAANTSNDVGTGIVWKPLFGTYTKRSAGIMQMGEGNYFKSGLGFFTNNTSNTTTDWSERMRISKEGNVGIGVTQPTVKLQVAGAVSAGGKITYTKSYASLNTTGNDVAGLNESNNGASASFTFTCHGHTGGYQKIVYSCWNTSSTTWNVEKVIDEGTNDFDVTVNDSGSTRTFTFVSRSGTKSYSPKVTVEATGSAINESYL